LITGIGLKTIEALGAPEATTPIRPRVEDVDVALAVRGAAV
jgi:hypothetical protein